MPIEPKSTDAIKGGHLCVVYVKHKLTLRDLALILFDNQYRIERGEEVEVKATWTDMGMEYEDTFFCVLPRFKRSVREIVRDSLRQHGRPTAISCPEDVVNVYKRRVAELWPAYEDDL